MTGGSAPTAFVTGATGFLGRNLTLRLIEAGWNVTAYCREAADLGLFKSLPITVQTGSILDGAALLQAMPDGVDCVFHLALSRALWVPDPAQLRRINVEGTRNLVAAALARRAGRLVLASSFAVWGLGRRDLHEDAVQDGAAHPVLTHRTFWQAEQAVRVGIDRGLAAVIVNPGHVVGRFDRGPLARLIAATDRGRLAAMPLGGGSFCHAAEVARALIGAATAGGNGERYLLGGADATFAELIALTADLAGRPRPEAPPLEVPRGWRGGLMRWRARIAREPPAVIPDLARVLNADSRIVSVKAMRDLGYRPVGLRDMVTDALSWTRQREAFD